MRVAIDGMGGDNSPVEIVKGAVEAVNEFHVDIVITGPEEKIKAELVKYNFDKNKIEILNTTEIVSLDESPVMAIRKKKDSSL